MLAKIPVLLINIQFNYYYSSFVCLIFKMLPPSRKNPISAS